ncbi:hypothetical protein [Streptomyces caniferus]|uniref:hypothetical protein n=1 Tax=Streptomyces caniferus TaxID=285557 RepID=UPI0037FDE5C1
MPYAPPSYRSDSGACDECDECDDCNEDTGAMGDGPEAWELGGGALGGGGVGAAVGVLGGGEAGGVTGWSGRDGVGFGPPGRPP